MKFSFPICVLLVSLALTPFLHAEPLDELRETAEAFVEAYNSKDLETMTSFYRPDAEVVSEIDWTVVNGREEIQSLFEESFEAFPERKLSLDVVSVRLITDSVAMEEGVANFLDPSDGSGLSFTYIAILSKDEAGSWKIAETRELRALTETDRVSNLNQLDWLVGKWTLRENELRMDVTIRMSNDGSFLLGEALTETLEGGAIETSIRIGYDASLETIRWWTFDSEGGFAGGHWTEIDPFSWRIQSNGVTAEGERNSAAQSLVYDGDSIIDWTSTARVISGASLPDATMRLVRQPPRPEFPVTERTQPTPPSAE
ncbi:MAG: nuclear transport factor 2 family protein [Verrucomicrobiota bacterium]